jgi:hypothetical protein
VRGNALHTTQSFKNDVVCRNTNADSVLRNYFVGGRIRKTETNVFEIRRDLGFRPAGGCGRNAGRAFWIFERIVVSMFYKSGTIFLICGIMEQQLNKNEVMK